MVTRRLFLANTLQISFLILSILAGRGGGGGGGGGVDKNCQAVISVKPNFHVVIKGISFSCDRMWIPTDTHVSAPS